jgi:arylsulfatase A-like enzyme
MPNDEQGDKSNVNSATLNRRNVLLAGTTLAVSAIAANGPAQVAQAQQPATTPSSGRKPNIIFIVSDDFGYGDAGAYLGGEARGMPTPNLDRLAAEGMQFLSFYAQPSCTPGRAAMQTGRIPNRSGMTTVAFQGQGGGLPAAEWTLASVLKTAGYKTFFTGKWHLGEDNYALPNAQGYDEMKYCGLYHLNAYTYADPT